MCLVLPGAMLPELSQLRGEPCSHRHCWPLRHTRLSLKGVGRTALHCVCRGRRNIRSVELWIWHWAGKASTALLPTLHHHQAPARFGRLALPAGGPGTRGRRRARRATPGRGMSVSSCLGGACILRSVCCSCSLPQRVFGRRGRSAVPPTLPRMRPRPPRALASRVIRNVAVAFSLRPTTPAVPSSRSSTWLVALLAPFWAWRWPRRPLNRSNGCCSQGRKRSHHILLWVTSQWRWRLGRCSGRAAVGMVRIIFRTDWAWVDLGCVCGTPGGSGRSRAT